MKKIALLMVFLMPVMMFGQTYESLWKQVNEAHNKDLPQTEQQVLRKIVVKAEKAKDYGQLMKAELQAAQAACSVSPDSLKPAVERLHQRQMGIKDPALKAVYLTVIGTIYRDNTPLDQEGHWEKAEAYYDQALQHPEQLAAVKALSYEPFVTKGDDSRLFNNDLLSLLGREAGRYDVMRDYYLKTDNRVAALLSSLWWIDYNEPDDDLVKYGESTQIHSLDSLADVYADLKEAGEVAIVRYRYMDEHTDASVREKWGYLEYALKRWGSWERMNYLRNEQNDLKQRVFDVRGEGIVLPDRPHLLKLENLRGISQLKMRVYRVKATAKELKDNHLYTQKDYDKIKSRLVEMPEMAQTMTFGDKAPYEEFEDSLMLGALPVGIYMLEFESQPQTKDKARSFYYVTGLRLMGQMLPNNMARYVVVNATTGQPVKNATISVKVNQQDVIMTTDDKGECLFDTKGARANEIFVTTDDDKACPRMYGLGWFYYNDNMRDLQHVAIMTDRAIYRPGQTVYATAVLYQVENGYENRVRKGVTVQMTLHDANGKEVASEKVTSDDFGTCATQFTLPRKGLTGRFYISVENHNNYFTVEEYKRPTFEVDIPKVTDNYADGDTLQVKGTARTYAGVPVQGGKVKYQVMRKRAYWWWRYSRYWGQGSIGTASTSDVLAEGELETNEKGEFEVPTPMVLPKTHYPMYYNFLVSVDVTDQAGETHHGELMLPLGNRETALSVDVPEKVLTEEGGQMTFHLYNAAGADVDASLRYRLNKGKWQQVKTNKKIELPKLKSGRYTIDAICGKDTLKHDFVVFSLNDKRPAIETDDWFYASASQFPSDGTPVTVQVGSSAKDVHVVYTILSGKTVVEKGSVDLSDELLNRKFTYKPEYGNGLQMAFAWVKEGKSYVHEVSIERPVPDWQLKMQWETFRDRLVPGQQEEWTLKVLTPDGKPAKAQLLATMYDKSLDQFVPHVMSLAPYLYFPIPRSNWIVELNLHYSFGSSEVVSKLNVPAWEFNMFDKSVFPSYYYRSRTRRTLMGYATVTVNMNEYEGIATTGLDNGMDEALQGRVAGLDIVESAGNLGSGSVKRVQGKSSNSVLKEVVTVPKKFDSAEEEVMTQPSTMQVRENLNETAFFYPRLMTDSEGRVTVKFTLPESLTTWNFMSVAHTEDMKTGFLSGEAVAKKDVMIIPNMPRFVRQGDKATITARIANTGEKSIKGKARLELLDPETMLVVSAQDQDVEVGADGTEVVSFEYYCIDESRSLLVAKVMVSGEGFSDGEQHYLPILPNKERVTVTVPFTQNEPGTKMIDLNSLKPQTSQLSPLSSQLTIEYTNNPAWFMIQALPTVGHPHDNCIVCQSTAYYANTIGRHILKQNPQTKNVFEAWTRDDTSLKSGLQKNEELKDLLLDETPWLVDANREQEQKERLADFFDENMMQQRLESSLNRMKDLQLADGSWSWWPGMDGSMYMTVEISEMLVRLNNLTAPQKETKQMLDKAFAYMGKEMVKLVDEMKKEAKMGVKQTFPSHKVLQWLYICTLDGRRLPADVQSANTYLKNLLKKETRNQTIYDKAMSAIVLNNKTYVKSLKEYTVYREEMGRYYDTQRALYSWRDYRIPTQVAAIEAIQRLTPEDKKTIEEMQRWLLQEKRNQAWDTPINSANAVYAFLNGNSESLKSQERTVLRVDGKEIETSKTTAGIGYVKTAMEGDDKQVFTAEKTSTGTSWGAVYMQFMQPTSDIENQSSGIKVKREILSAEANSQFSILNSPLKVGDRIKGRITIEADRDYDFVEVVDKRAACMEPVNQLSGYRYGYYTSPRDCSTNYYFNRLSKGQHIIETEYYIDRVGTYETGTCTAGCAYSPEFRGTAKSQIIEVK